MQKLVALAAEYDMLPQGGLVLCAVSGGADSMCLLHFLWNEREKLGITVAAGHYNHQLRGADAARDAQFVADWCAARGIPFYLGTGDVKGAAKARGRGIEEAARELRYAFLNETAAGLGAARIATAHNADDNVETMLLNLARGCGLRGLTGVPPRRDMLVRPLLTTTRADIEDYLERYGIEYVLDATNADTRFARNRIRTQIMPVLRALNPRVSETMAETVELLRRDEAALTARAAEAISAAYRTQDGLCIAAARIARLPAAIAPRAVRRMLEQAGDGSGKYARAHLDAVVALARGDSPSARVNLPGGLVAERVYGDLILTKDTPAPFDEVVLLPDAETAIGDTGWRVTVRAGVCGKKNPESRDTFWVKSDMIEGSILARARRTGDEIVLPGRARKRVKKLFIDEKVPRRLRGQVPILADARGILAVAGFGPHVPRLAQTGDAGLEITITKE